MLIDVSFIAYPVPRETFGSQLVVGCLCSACLEITEPTSKPPSSILIHFVLLQSSSKELIYLQIKDKFVDSSLMILYPIETNSSNVPNLENLDQLTSLI
jgi:hypothetical protein